MLIRALKTTTGRPKGTVHEVDDVTGKELVAFGYAVEELPLAKQEAAPVAANDNRPLAAEDVQTGFQTGADVPQSLSPADRVQPTLTSEQSWDAETAGSSPSTTDTDSSVSEQDKTQTSSTPATTTGGKRKRGRPRSKG